MTRRGWDSVAAALSILLLATLAAGTWYLAVISARGADEARAGYAPGEPDYFLENAVFTRINALGEPVFRMSADRVLHFPDDGSSTYEMPYLVSVDPAKPRLTLQAHQGRSNSDGSETLLTGDVVMVREQTASEPTMTIRTEAVTLFSETEIARTGLPVRIERGQSVLTGVGMEFDNAARSLKVDSRVSLTWQPPQPPRP